MGEREELEQVPWHELLAEAEPEDRRRRTIYLVAAVVGSMLIGMLVARTWWADGTPLPPVAVEEIVEPEDDGASADLALPTVPGLPLYSEADLMAFPDDPAQRVAVARAEWFVTDYFMVDLEPGGSSEVRSALPSGALASYPQDASDGISFVEWARAFRVEPLGDGSYRVSVLFRTLAAPPESGFMRQPVRAVDVLVAVRPDGGSTVLDVPAPAQIPAGIEQPMVAEAVAEPPPGVIEAAVIRSSGWGTDPRIVSVHRTNDEWRVVLTVADGAGFRWPLAVRVPG